MKLERKSDGVCGVVAEFVMVLRNDFWRLLIFWMGHVACVGGTTWKGIANKFTTWNEKNTNTNGISSSSQINVRMGTF